MFRSTKFHVIVVVSISALLGFLAGSSHLRFEQPAHAAGDNSLVASDANYGAATGSSSTAGKKKPLLAMAETQIAQAQPSRASGSTNGKKPNILFIMGDDVGWFNIGAYHRGMMSGKTPNLDKLASQGMLFTDYYAEASCTAGRANFITGEIPLRTGLTTVGQAGADVGIPAKACTLATALKAQGYATGQFGKNHLGDLNKFLPTVHGFDEFFGYLYHLDAMSDPYWYSFPDDQAYRDKFGPRNLVHCYASETDDRHRSAAVGPGWQAKDCRRRPAAAVPGYVERAEHAQHFPEGEVRYDHLRRSAGQKLVRFHG